MLSCPVPITGHQEIVLGHGSGGKLTHQLIRTMILPIFQNELLAPLHDGAVFSAPAERLAFSTDSYVVRPPFFPGGDIGALAVNGTVNDLAMCGARPLYLSASFIIEESLPMDDLRRIVISMREAADAAGVKLVTGDTKVVDRGKGDKIFINTAGIGAVGSSVTLDPRSIQPGDIVILSGTIGDHGLAIMSVREGLTFESPILSDTAPLHGLAAAILEASSKVRVLRDPTRGGVASALNEFAEQSRVGIAIQESAIPVRPEVQGACEILGLDPLYVANEGKLLAIVAPEDAEQVLHAMRALPAGIGATVVGEVTADSEGIVVMRTRIGGSRVVDMLSGDQLPRIC